MYYMHRNIEVYFKLSPTDGKSEIKVMSMPIEVIEQLMDENSELEMDDEDDETGKLVLNFTDAQ